MAHYLTINQRKEFGKPPAHYKLVGRQLNNPKLKAPNLEHLTKGNRDYHLVMQGQTQFKIPLKWNNPFLFNPTIPSDHPG